MPTLKPKKSQWRLLADYPGYKFCSDGSVWTQLKTAGSHWHGDTRKDFCSTWKRLKGSPRKEDSRLRVTLRNASGEYIRRYISYFILLAFHGPQPIGCESRHMNGDCTDDHANNLCWGSSSENKADMLRHGTRIMGAGVHTAKLTAMSVLAIRKRRASGDGIVAIASEFGVTASNISSICNRKSWKHL